MDEIVQGITSPAVILALEANMRDYWLGYGEGTGCERYEDASLAQFITGAPVPLLNGVFPNHRSAAAIDIEIATAVERAAARHIPMFWWVGPSAPPEFTAHLAQRDIVQVGATPGMAISLTDLPAELPMPPDFTIERVETAAQLETWLRALLHGYEMPPDLYDQFLPIEASIMLDRPHPQREYFLGYQRGEPVAASAMQSSSGVVAPMAVAVAPEARRQGIGAAITLAPLYEGRARGYRVATLQASEMGYPVYRRIGFQDVCQIALYLSPPAD